MHLPVLFERRVALRAPSHADECRGEPLFGLVAVGAADHTPGAPPAPSGRSLGWARALTLALLLLGGLAFFLRTVNEHYPIGEWLFLRYAKYWIYAALPIVASFAAGLRLLAWLFPVPPRLGERCVLALSLGVLCFGLGIFVCGLAGGLGPLFLVAWPLGLLAAGSVPLRRLGRELARRFRRLGFRSLLPRGPLELGAALFIVAGAVALYLQVLTPGNVGYDAGWYHLTIAEQYAVTGEVPAFREGWYLGAYPHFASWLYAWAFLVPGELFDHRAVAAHLEWALFLATLAAMGPLVRRLVHGERVPFAGAALFLFPGIFLYDSNLIVGADHVLAFFAPGLGIALIRLGRRFDARAALLAGALTGAALLTKYQGTYFLLPAALFVGLLVVRARRSAAAGVWALAVLAVSAPHWLKNWLWYGDPMYPLLHDFVASHPFHTDAAAALARAYWVPVFELTGTLAEKLVATAKALVTFSFIPHDWITFHDSKPVFGSLFTLTLPALLLLRRTARIWLLALGVHLGLVVWFVTSHQDRFLQALLPWMAACTAAVLVRTWRESRLARVPLLLLVATQIVWGGDVYFFRTHAMAGDAPLKALVDYVAAGHRKQYRERHELGDEMRRIGELVPAGATVLMHRHRDRLGLPARTMTDESGWQGAIEYLELGGAHATLRRWHELGVTHVLWRDDCGGMSPEDLAREAVFAGAVAQASDGSPHRIGGWQIAKLGTPPWYGPSMSSRIAWLGCGGDPPLGIYDPQGLAIRVPAAVLREQTVAEHTLEAIGDVDALVLRPSCDYAARARPTIERHFDKAAMAGDVSLWLRRPGGPLTATVE